jgi:hypothetical protein
MNEMARWVGVGPAPLGVINSVPVQEHSGRYFELMLAVSGVGWLGMPDRRNCSIYLVLRFVNTSRLLPRLALLVEVPLVGKNWTTQARNSWHSATRCHVAHHHDSRFYYGTDPDPRNVFELHRDPSWARTSWQVPLGALRNAVSQVSWIVAV